MTETFSFKLENAEKYLNNNKIIKQTDEQLIIQTKLDVISLAYSDHLSKKDLLELSVILEGIADFKDSSDKRKDYK